MLSIRETMKKEGNTEINGTIVMYHFAEVDATACTITQMYNSIVNFDLYKENYDECRQNINDFENAVFDLVEELKSNIRL